MSTDDFVSLLLAVGPEVRQIYDEHLADFDEALLHLLVAKVRDLAISAFDRGDDDLSKRLVAAFDTGLRLGDDRVVNAVAVSFVRTHRGRTLLGKHSSCRGLLDCVPRLRASAWRERGKLQSEVVARSGDGIPMGCLRAGVWGQQGAMRANPSE